MPNKLHLQMRQTPLIGVLGGMGSASTVDFLDKLVRITPAAKDQEHLSWVALNLAYVPDRSAAITGSGESPLPSILDGVKALDNFGVGLIVIPCNTAHHWFAEIEQLACAPVANIAEAAVDAVSARAAQRIAVLASRGTIKSGFFQAALHKRGHEPVVPEPQMQQHIDECMRLVKAGRIPEAAKWLTDVAHELSQREISGAILGCTEIPLAATEMAEAPIEFVDSTLALAHHTLDRARANGWLPLRGV